MNYANADRLRADWEEVNVQYKSTKNLLVAYMKKRGNMKGGCCLSLLDTLVAWVVGTMRVEKPCRQKLLIPTTGD